MDQNCSKQIQLELYILMKNKALFNQGSPSVNFSPNITINVGNNSDKSVVGDIKEAVRQALEDEYAKLLNILGTGEVV